MSSITNEHDIFIVIIKPYDLCRFDTKENKITRRTTDTRLYVDPLPELYPCQLLLFIHRASLQRVTCSRSKCCSRCIGLCVDVYVGPGL